MVKLIFLFIWFIIHPVHVSLLSIDFAPDQNRLNVFIKIYYDDFLTDSGIGEKGTASMKFPDSGSVTGDLIGKYINEKVRIIVNSRQVEGKLENFNLADNELTMNLSYGSVYNISTITVKNLIMTDLYADMANMLIIRVHDFEKGVRMTPEETEQTFNFNNQGL
jgi:hypothetical protein